jgi:hypothetical protein
MMQPSQAGPQGFRFFSPELPQEQGIVSQEALFRHCRQQLGMAVASGSQQVLRAVSAKWPPPAQERQQLARQLKELFVHQCLLCISSDMVRCQVSDQPAAGLYFERFT